MHLFAINMRTHTLMAVPYSGTRQMMYQTTKGYLVASGILADSPYPFILLAVVAMTSGAIGQFVANPTDVLKVFCVYVLCVCVCMLSASLLPILLMF